MVIAFQVVNGLLPVSRQDVFVLARQALVDLLRLRRMSANQVGGVFSSLMGTHISPWTGVQFGGSKALGRELFILSEVTESSEANQRQTTPRPVVG